MIDTDFERPDFFFIRFNRRKVWQRNNKTTKAYAMNENEWTKKRIICYVFLYLLPIHKDLNIEYTVSVKI